MSDRNAAAAPRLISGRDIAVAVCAKMALHDAGHEVFHFSHPRHGFAPTGFGIRYLNAGNACFRPYLMTDSPRHRRRAE